MSDAKLKYYERVPLKILVFFVPLSIFALMLFIECAVSRSNRSESRIICCEETLTTHDRNTRMRYVILKKCSNGKDDTVSATPSPYFN